jgi:transitional endoplasmic reticulum ATPase
MTNPITTVNNVSVTHTGTQIILPLIDGKPMAYDEAIEWMKRKKQEDEQEVAVHHVLPCSPLDGAYAFHRAIAQKYGWSQGVPTPGFFSNRPPAMIGMQISATETVQVLWGRVEIPGIEGFLDTDMETSPNPCFVIGGKVKKKHSGDVLEIVSLTKQILKESSIYKGSAIKVSFEWDREDDHYDPMEHCPKFMHLDGITDNDLIFGETTLNDITIGLFTPIEQAEACRRYGVPLKRGILLHGPYGTGKTMTAYVSALKAVRNGWTFVYLDSVLDLKKGLEFAAQYAPCVLFAEDIDRVISGERSLSMDEVLNTLDGVDTKGAEIITVFTTNHLEDINPAMLRMGRLDTLVEVSPPDAAAAQRLVKLYARGLLAKDVDLKRIGKALEGRIPAFIREVTERAKIAAIARTGGKAIDGNVLEGDLLNAAKAMEPHVRLLEPREEKVIGSPELFVRVPEGHSTAARTLLHNLKTAS